MSLIQKALQMLGQGARARQVHGVECTDDRVLRGVKADAGGLSEFLCVRLIEPSPIS
ncbi:hypothetical protein [Acidovorax sp.]|uniref:hypothetical protein n=1 Tax=Acidovorax sp. TaxID=1872122 RepID=UPI00258FD932|nr:hypothetical protein [Acidovorax sp.]